MKKHPVSIDDYAYRSGIRNWNTACKVIFSASALLAVIMADSLCLSVMTILYMGGISCGAGKIRGGDYIRLLLVPAVFIFISGTAVLWEIGNGEESIFSLSLCSVRLYVTAAGLRRSLLISLKAFAAVSCMYVTTLSTPMGGIINFLGRLPIPRLLTELMHFIYRYIFLLGEIHDRQKDAARARMGDYGGKKAFRIFGVQMADLIVVSMRRAGEYYDALESRGYGENCLFYEEHRKIGAGQLAACLLYAGLALCCLTAGV